MEEREYLALVYVKRLIRQGFNLQNIKTKLKSTGWMDNQVNAIFNQINVEKTKKQQQDLVDVADMKFEQALLNLVDDLDQISLEDAAKQLGVSVDKANELLLTLGRMDALYVENRNGKKFLLSMLLGEKRIIDNLMDSTPHKPDYYKNTITKLDDFGELLKQKGKIDAAEAMRVLKINAKTLDRYVTLLESKDFLVRDEEKGKVMFVLNS